MLSVCIFMHADNCHIQRPTVFRF